MCARHFQELSASDSVGWLLRGGISIGQLFIDDVMVCGEMLMNGFQIMQKEAGIKIDEKLYQNLSVPLFIIF